MPVISLCFKKKNTSSSDSSSLLLFSSLPGNPDFPPLLLGKVRPLLKIGITILLLVSMHITHLLSSWFKRPSVFSPVMCISQSITSAIPPSWFQIELSSLQNFQANTKVTFNQSSSAKWAHWTTLLTCPVPSLYCAFTQTCSLPPMS